jgi:hypothetical protein
MIRKYLALLGLFCLIVAGCSSDVQTDIVGEWKGMTAKQDLAFFSDSRVEMKGHSHGVYKGRYTIEDGNKLTCDFPRLSKPVICTAKIRGEKLLLVFPGGREEVYTKK